MGFWSRAGQLWGCHLHRTHLIDLSSGNWTCTRRTWQWVPVLTAKMLSMDGAHRHSWGWATQFLGWVVGLESPQTDAMHWRNQLRSLPNPLLFLSYETIKFFNRSIEKINLIIFLAIILWNNWRKYKEIGIYLRWSLESPQCSEDQSQGHGTGHFVPCFQNSWLTGKVECFP